MEKTDNHDGYHHHGEHAHGHHHGIVKNIKIAFFINLVFAAIELVGGILTNSVAILTDALHDLGDTIALGLAWYLEKVSSKDKDEKFTYGYARFSVLAALINSLILIIGSVFLLSEAIPRILNPEPADAKGMLLLALVGVTANGLAAWRLFKGSTLNERVVALHLLEDVLGWVAIIVGSIVMMFADIPILDPILSVMILAYILFGVVKNLNKSIRIFLQGTPEQVAPESLVHELQHVEGVLGVHDFHVWSLDGEYHIATMHVVVSDVFNWKESDKLKERIRECLKKFHVEHATIELEPECSDCQIPHGESTVQDHGQHGHSH